MSRSVQDQSRDTSGSSRWFIQINSFVASLMKATKLFKWLMRSTELFCKIPNLHLINITVVQFRQGRCTFRLPLVTDPKHRVTPENNYSRLHTANLSWQTRVGKPKLVCVNGSKTGGKHVCKLLASNWNVFSCRLFWCRTHTPTWVCQHEFPNLRLPCLDLRFALLVSVLEPGEDCLRPIGGLLYGRTYQK